MNEKSTMLSFPSSVIANPLTRMKQSLCMSFLRRQESRIFLSLRAYVVSAAISIMFFFALPSSAFAQEKIPVFPTTPVEAYTVYGSLALLWLGILGLIVIIKMKLNEIERIQKLGIDREDEDAPMLK